MPVYEYKCNDCSTEFEQITTSVSREPRAECPACKSINVTRQISATSRVKATGFPAAGRCGGPGGFS